jgi:PAS domain S-box-containing protein
MKNHDVPPLRNGNRRPIEEAMFRVLCVDDENCFLDSAKQILELQGSFSVETASSVNEALQKMTDKLFDVIVSDYMMPEKNGLDFLRELRENGNDIPFILFTGKGREEVAVKALNLGAHRYFNKVGRPETVYAELAYGIRQVAAQRRAEKALHDSEEKYRNMIEQAPDSIITFDVNGVVTSCNPTGLSIIGCSEDEIIGKPFSELSSIIDIPKFRKMFWSLSDGKTLEPFVVSYYNNGKLCSGEVHVSLMKEGNNIIGFQAIIRDITEHKKAEAALRQSEKRFRELSELLPEVIFEMDSNGVLRFVNHEGYNRFGYSREEFDNGLNAVQMLVPEDRDRAGENIGKVLRGETIGSNEYTALKKDGSTFPIIIKSAPIIRGDKIGGVRGIMVDITGHKKAEDELRESEEKFRTLAEQSPNMIFINQEGRIVYVNRKCEELMGYTNEEFCSPDFNFFTLVSPESREAVKSSFSKHLNCKEVPSYEYSLVTKEGKRMEAILTTKLITYQCKNAILGTITDITEFKKTRENLIKERETLEKVTGNLSAALTVISKDFRILWANKFLEDFLGDIKGKTCYSALNQLNYICPECRVKEVFETGKQAIHEQVVQGSHNQDVWLEITAIPIKDKNGDVTEVLELALDVTKRKQMENAIREGEDKLRTLLDTANVLVQSVDANGRFVYVNKEWMKILGYSTKDFKSLTLMDIIRSDYCKHCMDTFKQVINGKAVSDIEAVFVSKDGNEIRVRGNAKPIFRDGKFVSTVGLFADITERKKAEETLNETLTKLETLNEKLGVVGKLTRHDARNKLSIISNNIYLAKQRLADNHAALEYLDAIESAVGQMEKIFGFARVYEMLGAEELSYVDVKKSVDEAILLLSGSDDKIFVNECEGLTVLADSLLRQVFYNLIDNSLKYGEKVTQIRVHYKEGKDELKLVYDDDGVGISEDKKEVIFKEGYGKGTGYGLYLIKKACEAYGWTIKETGVHSKGAQFTITVPKAIKNGKTSYIITRAEHTLFETDNRRVN